MDFTNISYLTVAAIFTASAFVVLFKNETAILNVYFDEKYKKILDEAATIAASDSFFDDTHRDNR